MTRDRRGAILAALLLIAALFGVVKAETAQAASYGWITGCNYSHANNDDLIKFPGQPGASHLHRYAGSRVTDAFATYDSLIASGNPWNSTCKSNTQDTAAYWWPSVTQNGNPVTDCTAPIGSSSTPRCVFYYRENNVSATYLAAHPVEPFPAGFSMIAGNSAALTDADNPYLGRELYFGCSDNSTGKLKAPTNCATGFGSIHVGFPNCWDGVNPGFGVNAAPHLRYPSGGVCPAGFERLLPRVIFRMEYATNSVPASVTGLISDPVGAAHGGVSLHGDFVNSWQQPALVALTQRCLNALVDCGNNPTP